MGLLVLVVDDDTSIRETVRDVLVDEGYDVALAANGREALDYLRRSPPPAPALIVMDLVMPVMDGWSFRAEQSADATLSEIPVVIMSASGRRPAGTHFVPKPFGLDTLLDTVKEHASR